jgi:hypothetical protein
MVPFSNYANLMANIAETLNRQDLLDAIPGFVQLVEGKVNADDRFRCLASLVRSQAPLADQYMALPADYISMLNFRNLGVYGTTSPGDPPLGRLDELTPAQADIQRQLLPNTDTPKFFINLGQEFELLPSPDQEYLGQMIYYALVPPLASSETGTNWLLSAYPNIYYYGSLLEAAPYLRNDDRIAVWDSQYEKMAEQIKISNDRGQFSGAPMKMRTNRRYR